MKDSKRLIAIADDEKDIRDILTLLLTGDGYAVAAYEDGQALLEHASADVDLYILDINMPRLSGILTAAGLRRKCETPIIFLTAYSGESDKVMGFSAGADDYIVKPFSNIELLMRVRAILKRSSGSISSPSMPVSNQLIIHDVTLDMDRQCVLKNGSAIALTHTEFRILELLATHKKKIYSLENIYQSIWGEDAVGDGTIMAHIKNIRKKLGDNSRNPLYIKTAWGRGYYID